MGLAVKSKSQMRRVVSVDPYKLVEECWRLRVALLRLRDASFETLKENVSEDEWYELNNACAAASDALEGEKDE